MNKFLIGIAFLITTNASAQDLFLQTRVEQNTLSSLVDKSRVLLNNADIGDHLKGVIDFKDDITFSIDELIHDPDFLTFKDVFSSVFKLDLKNAVIRIRIPKIGYQIEELHAKPLNIAVQDPILDLGITAFIKGYTTTLNEGLDLDLMINNPKSNKLESYLTAHLAPTTINIPNTIEPLSFNIDFEVKRDQEFKYNLKNYDLTSIPDYINRHIKDLSITESDKKVPISSESISVNPVTVKLSNLTRTLNFDTFKPILQKKFDVIISSIISKLGLSLQDSIGPMVLKAAFSDTTRSDLIIQNDHIYTRYLTSSFSQPASNQLKLGVTGEVCTADLFKQFNDQCNQHVNFPAPVRVISEEDHQKANEEISESLSLGNSDLVLSMSEEYINRLLYSTIQAKLWNDTLDKQHLTLGPKGAFLIFNQRTATPELFLDVIYSGDGKGVQGLLVNKNKPLRFPLKINTSIDFINQNGIPHMIIKTNKVLSTIDEIILGVPEYDLPSHLIPMFKKKIAKMVLKMSADIEGQTAVDMDLPILKNIDLEKTLHEASPFGRLNLFFKL